MPEVWPWPEQQGKVEDHALYDEEVIAVFRVLDSWFGALDDGSHVYRMPDPDYQRPLGKPPFTDAQTDKLVTVALDEWFAFGNPNSNYARDSRGFWHDAGPEFSRLAPPQRLALAQELEAVMRWPGAAASSPAQDPETGTVMEE